jgi:DNA-binding CsgD family transcriptional regulator
VSDGLAFFDAEGMLLHTNRVLQQAVRQPGSGKQLQKEVLALARTIGSSLRAQMAASAEAIPTGEQESREIRTASGTYRIRGSYIGFDLIQSGATVLVTLRRSTEPPPLSDETLQERFGLSRTESRVARLIAAGQPNQVIAEALGISPHTVRNHTSHVLAKLGVRARAEVGPRLGSWKFDAGQ